MNNKDDYTFEQFWKDAGSLSPDDKNTADRAEDIAAVVNSLVQRRVNAGLSQRALADLCGMKQPQLARIESLQSMPRLDTLVRISRALGGKLTLTCDSDSPADLPHSPFDSRGKTDEIRGRL